MNNKISFLRVISVILGVLLVSILINYSLNPYGIFRKYKNYNVSTPINERYLKTSYILNNPNKYDSFIFGSSRVGTLKGENLEKIGRFYNMSFSSALPCEILEILKTFITKGIKIKNIILGIDDSDFYTIPEKQQEILYKLSYKKLKMNKYNFVKYYLLKNPINKINFTYVFKKEKTFIDILETGKWEKKYTDIKIESNIEKHREILSNIKIIPNREDRVEKTISEIKQIINICKKNKINLTIIYLPRYKSTYVANKDLIDKSRVELQKITSYWDMVKIDSFTDDEYYWYEESHYRPILGEIILKTIFKDDFDLIPKIQPKENFGKYVEKL